MIRYQYIAAEHIAILLTGGVEDSSSDFAKSWIGIIETYRFEERLDETELTVDITTDAKWEKMFDEGWPGALQKLKEVCEGERSKTGSRQSENKHQQYVPMTL